MCVDDNCPLKDKCHRYTAKPSLVWQSYGDFSYNFGCDYYWDNNVQLIKSEKYEPIRKGGFDKTM